MKLLRRLLLDENGQGLVEYALILAFVAVAVVAVLKTLGEHTIPFYSNGELEAVLSP